MHTLMVISGGLALLGAFLLIGYLARGRSFAQAAQAAKYFIPVWAVVSLVNLSVGVLKAGYTVVQELPMLVIVFGIPAAAAWFILRRYSGGPS